MFVRPLITGVHLGALLTGTYVVLVLMALIGMRILMGAQRR